MPRIRRLSYTSDALDNLVDIVAHVFLQSQSRSVAEGLAQRIQGRCRKIASLSGLLGRARPELGDDIRSFAEGNYVVFFRYREPDVLEVIAILEGHRDVEHHFAQRSE